MTIGAGQILDKYELIEKVGQGGMAVVYRGLDRSLRREVAIKILHSHLADFEEARDRFEREAHAVAKLRHENILEIYAFSGRESDESYIVTEFIAGQTLREFIADYHIKFPEVGVMIAAHVCRALGHAHTLGVLHRDVKPENIMIRDDGIVKLTDFGIAQILDHERMTVTGQLLGSPAYMSPEHVEGRRLDFRTDVFAVGIVLYQLVTGVLPFTGKNPHEVLKRIAECEYEDPRKVNPRVGNELGRIINRALARDPDQRFADISEMLRALEAYLSGSGMGDTRDELARFFAAPASYEMALRERLVPFLVERGRELMNSDRVAALQLFDRVLNIDPEHEGVLAIIQRMSHRRRRLHLAALVAALAVAVAGAYAVRAAWRSAPGDEVAWASKRPERSRSAARAATRERSSGAAAPGSRPRAGAARPAEPAAAAAGDPARDAGSPSSHATGDAAALATRAGTPGQRERKPPPGAARPIPRTDAGQPAPAPATRSFTLVVFPHVQAEYRVGGGPWQAVAGKQTPVELPPGHQTIEVRNQRCCQSRRVTIAAADPGGRDVSVPLGFLPATVTPECDEADVRVQIDGASARLHKAQTIPISSTLGRIVTVTFIGKHTDTETVKVSYNEAKIVTCSFD